MPIRPSEWPVKPSVREEHDLPYGLVLVSLYCSGLDELSLHMCRRMDGGVLQEVHSWAVHRVPESEASDVVRRVRDDLRRVGRLLGSPSSGEDAVAAAPVAPLQDRVDFDTE